MKYLALISFSVILNQAFAQIKYVDAANGDDNYDGNTTSTAWQTIQKAMDEATPGTTVFIRTGNYIEPGLQLNVSGTAGAEIVFRNYPGESPIVNGNGQATTILYIENQSYFEIHGLIFTNAVGNYAVGVEITGDSHHFIFRKNHLHDIRWNAANTLPTFNDNANAFVVYGTTANGIHDIIIDSNEINNNWTGFSENLTLDGNVYNFQVIANTVHDNTNIGILCAGNYGVIADPALDQARDGLVRDNICYNNTSNYAASAGIYIDGGKNIDVFRNLCFGNGFGIEVGAEENGTTTQIRVYDNLVYDNREAGISIGGYDSGTTGQVTQTTVRNNTFYNNGISGNSLGELYMTKASDCLIENNIFASETNGKLVTREAISPQTNNTFQYNLWYGFGGIDADIDGTNYSDFASVNNLLNQNFALYDDPDFNSTTTGNYNLAVLGSSPAINAGNPASTFYLDETDYAKGPRISETTVDIGAYEWNVTSTSDLNTIILEVYPNPANRLLNIKSNDNGILTLVSMNGQIIANKQMENEEILNISTLENGLYLLKLETEKGITTKVDIKN